MTNILHYSLRNISPQTLNHLQEHYPNASVKIELSEQPQYGGMTESDFWALIETLDWSKLGDDNAVIAPVVQRLVAAPFRHIYDFTDILSHKLYLLDGERYSNGNEDADFVADRFLYIRCCVVANGLAFFNHIQQYPKEMPHNLLFAALLRIPSEAYRQKTGKSMEHISAYPIETYSNPNGWHNLEIRNQDL
jgi:hypothetical protein